jgi:hypothetical protein
MSHTRTIELPGRPPYQIHHIYCPEVELNEEQLQRLVDGIDLCFHIEDDPHGKGHRVDYELSPWQKRLFEHAKRIEILVNPTIWRYEHDALQNVWEAYQGMHNRPVVILRIAPTLGVAEALLGSGIFSSPRDVGMGSQYTVAFRPAFHDHLTPEGLEELRILIGLYGPNLAKTKILAKYSTVNQVDRLHGGTKPAHAVWE